VKKGGEYINAGTVEAYASSFHGGKKNRCALKSELKNGIAEKEKRCAFSAKGGSGRKGRERKIACRAVREKEFSIPSPCNREGSAASKKGGGGGQKKAIGEGEGALATAEKNTNLLLQRLYASRKKSHFPQLEKKDTGCLPF